MKVEDIITECVNCYGDSTPGSDRIRSLHNAVQTVDEDIKKILIG